MADTEAQSGLRAQRRPRSRKSIAHMPSPDRAAPTEDKENVEDGGTGSSASHASKSTTLNTKSSSKKSRSKSMGPGGLDALKEGAGNRQKLNVAPAVKSILKPTIPLSPLKEIPSRSSTRKAQEKKSLSPAKPSQSASGMLIDVSVPNQSSGSSAGVSGTDTLLNPFDSTPGKASENIGKAMMKKPEPTQHVQAVSTVGEQRKRDVEKQTEQARRDARRKSLANRRVSFAPEATLHTWDVVEYFQESTASTDSTRRASSASPRNRPETPGSQDTPQVHASPVRDPPSTPPEQASSTLAASASPTHQRDMHQKKRRRSSIGNSRIDEIPPPNEPLSSSPYSGSSNATSEDVTMQSLVMNNEDDTFNSESETMEGNSTVMSIGDDDTTRQSFISASSSNPPTGESSGQLNEALQQAARQAGTQGIQYDEHGDLSMEIANDETTAAFKPWTRKANQGIKPTEDLTSFQDQENQNPFSPAFKVATDQGASKPDKRHGTLAPRNPLATQHEQGPSGEGSSMGDETMDLTMAVGGIEDADNTNDNGTLADDNEQLSMELTTMLGGVLPPTNITAKKQRQSLAARSQIAGPHAGVSKSKRAGGSPAAEDTAMDMTMAVGGILPSFNQQEQEDDDETQRMDITTAVGGILPSQTKTSARSAAKEMMKYETDVGESANSPIQTHEIRRSPPQTSTTPTPKSTTASPGMASARSRPSIRRENSPKSNTPTRSTVRQNATPTKKPSTPSKQITPLAPRPSTPGKTPPLKDVAMRSASPRKLFKTDTQNRALTPRSARDTRGAAERTNPGISTPSMILAPKRRRSSGIGIDKEGLGSPQVTAKFEKRRSLGEGGPSFSIEPGRKNLRFEDPQDMQVELEQERREDERRESGRVVLEREADGHMSDENDETANLKDMIQSLTPKRKLKGRKSLHVGAARGVLGKRPAELDEEEDEDDEGSAKKIKGREGSPVKKVMLPPPPPKMQTSGRAMRESHGNLPGPLGKSLDATPSMSTSPSKNLITTPTSQGRYRDAEAGSSAKKPIVPFVEKLDETDQQPEDPQVEEEPIQLQDFLNMTSIRFMELTTTKRRPTIAPGSRLDVDASGGKPSSEQAPKVDADGNAVGYLERSVVAGASTLPMLELYQHSCRELKKYISEGRKIVREIETDTFEENPPLFREYISASPDVKFIMDAQFKNVKTHARLLSKAMWYEWRMKLLDGLKDGLDHISQGMTSDHQTLQQQEGLVWPLLEPMVNEVEHLENENAELQDRVNELQDCDQEDLKETRRSLVAADQDILVRQKRIEEMRHRLEDTKKSTVALTQQKSKCVAEMSEAEKIREECRGWSASELGSLKASVDALERKHGWAIASVNGTVVTATLKREISITFDAGALQHDAVSPNNNGGTAKPELGYVEADDDQRVPISVEKGYLIGVIQEQLQRIPLADCTAKDLLSFTSHAWAKATAAVQEIRRLNLQFPTDVELDGNRRLSVKSTLLLPSLATKVQVAFHLGTADEAEAQALGLSCSPTVVYGEKINEAKMREFLEERVGHVFQGPNDPERVSWVRAVEELRTKLLTRGRK